MGLRVKILLVLLVIAVLANLPTFACIVSHSPSGDLGETSTTKFTGKVESLVRCVTPTGVFGIALFLIGGFASVVVEEEAHREI